MAGKDQKTAEPVEPKKEFKLGDNLPGHRLLKPGKKLTIGGRNFVRAKDVEVEKVKDGKKVKETIKTITKISYVPDAIAKTVNEKHFETAK